MSAGFRVTVDLGHAPHETRRETYPAAGRYRGEMDEETNMRISPVAVAAAVGLAAGSASAASVGGHAALALAAIVGGTSAMVGLTDRAALAVLLDGKPTKTAKWRKIVVKSDAVVCRAGNIDVTAFQCDLIFGAKKVSLQGRRAHELFATILEADVPGEGAAGTIYETMHNLSCTIDTATIALISGKVLVK